MNKGVRFRMLLALLLSASAFPIHTQGKPVSDRLYNEYIGFRAITYCYRERGLPRDFISDYTKEYFAAMPADDFKNIDPIVTAPLESPIGKKVRKDLELAIDRMGGCSGIAQEAMDFIKSQTEQEMPLRGEKEGAEFKF